MEETGSYRIPSVERARVSDAMNKAVALYIAGIVGWREA